MKHAAQVVIILSFILCLAVIGYAQETSVTLPTNDNTSSFNVKNQAGTDVFKVDGSGRMTGDGSGLSNVRPIVVFSNGDSGAPEHYIVDTTDEGYFIYQGRGFVFREGYIPGLNPYEAQIMKELTINCPGPGIIIAQATGYADWRSRNEDLARIWFHPHPDVTPNDWETPDYHNLMVVSDYQCTDRTDQYTSWAISKCYTVSSAQNFTVRICADKYFNSSALILSGVSMQLIYFPTGGTN